MYRSIFFLSLITMLGPRSLQAEEGGNEEGQRERPLVRGGAYDKPYIFMSGTRRAKVGGYAEAHFRYEREEGVTEELTFVPKRFNLFVYSAISDRFRMAAELEFEEGTEEILLELAILDFEIHPAVALRAGMLLTPLGKFNLAHDSPANKLTDRPLVSTQVIGTTLSEPGMGVFGAFYPSVRSRITYELYAVNGFNAGLVEKSDEGIRIAEGRENIEDNNNRPAFAGRIGISPVPEAEVAFSWHNGQYNLSEIEGLVIDEKRYLTILVLDGEYRSGRYEVLGEYARAKIDLPSNLRGTIYAEKQQGLYLQGSAAFLRDAVPSMPGSFFEGVTRLDWVDFDTDLKGDTHTRLTLGLNFRPTADSVLKFNYLYNWTRDRLNVEVPGAGILFSVATYF